MNFLTGASLLALAKSIHYPEAILMLFSVKVKTYLSHTYWSVRFCLIKACKLTETFFFADIFSNGANAKSCVFDKNKPTGQTSCIRSLHCKGEIGLKENN